MGAEIGWSMRVGSGECQLSGHAHKKNLFIAMLGGGSQSPVTWTVANEPNAIRRLVRRLEREAVGPVQCCYEAGPGGSALQRRPTTDRARCQMIAPALIPRKPG